MSEFSTGDRQGAKRDLLLAAALLLASAPGCETPPRLESQTPFELGRDAARIKDYSTAVAQLTVAINNARDYVFTAAHLERAECHLKKAGSESEPAVREQELQSALDDVSVVLGQPELPAAEYAQAFTLQGRTLLEKEDTQGAQQAFERILTLDLDPQDRSFLLAAHRELGWILLNRARAGSRTGETALDELKAQEEFREAQSHFSRGLEIEHNDEECNLGKGICLHSRGQDRDAIAYLQRSTELSDARGTLNPRGHYYLGLSMELQKGYQETALEHFRQAAEQDSQQTFTPLYAHLVNVLLVYVSFEDPQFSWFFDKMLSFSGSDQHYWISMEQLADRLASDANPPKREVGQFARAVARARTGKIEAAVADALLLKDSPGFLQLLSRVFPIQPRRAELLYGRALALLGARRHQELASFFEDAAFRVPDASLVESEHFQKALVLEGKNIIALWIGRDSPKTPLNDQQKTERDKYLAKAIGAFQAYLARHPDDREVTLALGEAQELTDEFYKAAQSYARIGKANPNDPEPFRRIARLHEGKLLNAQQTTEAWIALLGYTGNDPDILEHIQRSSIALRSQILLYCQGCGRKGTEGDSLCLECGRQIGSAVAGSQ